MSIACSEQYVPTDRSRNVEIDLYIEGARLVEVQEVLRLEPLQIVWTSMGKVAHQCRPRRSTPTIRDTLVHPPQQFRMLSWLDSPHLHIAACITYAGCKHPSPLLHALLFVYRRLRRRYGTQCLRGCGSRWRSRRYSSKRFGECGGRQE